MEQVRTNAPWRMCADVQTRGRSARSVQAHAKRKQIMSILKRGTAVLVGALLVSACAATPKQESTGEYVDDSWITTKVKAAILNEPGLKVSQINVETYKGVVQLSGFVDSTDAGRKAVEVARSVKGVSDVKNDTRLR